MTFNDSYSLPLFIKQYLVPSIIMAFQGHRINQALLRVRPYSKGRNSY